MSKSRKSIEEINQIPPELPNDSAKEFAPLPDEFNRAETTAEPKGKRSSSMRKVMLYIASVGVVTLGVITPIIRVHPQEDIIVEASATPAPSPVATKEAGLIATPAATAAPTDTPTPTPTLTPTPTPTPTPTLTPTPRLMGQIHITVYSDLLDRDAARRGETFPSEILAEEWLPAETFEEYELPPLPERKGYRALGYVLLGSSGEAYLNDLLNGTKEPSVIGSLTLGDRLTPDDFDIVPKDMQGIYEAEIHTVWLSTAPSDFQLVFWDGTEQLGSYYIWLPVDSAGLLYLAPFPKPEKEGKTFVGWSDADKHMIDAVTWYDFFTKRTFDSPLQDRNIYHHTQCNVYACWSDGSGGAPDPTPVPTPRPQLVTLKCSGCSYSSNAGSGSSGNLPKGTKVTVTAYSNSSSIGWFNFSPGSASSMNGVLIDGVWNDKKGMFKYSVTFTIQTDTVVRFVLSV